MVNSELSMKNQHKALWPDDNAVNGSMVANSETPGLIQPVWNNIIGFLNYAGLNKIYLTFIKK